MDRKKYIILGGFIVFVMIVCISVVINDTFALPARFMSGTTNNCETNFNNCSDGETRCTSLYTSLGTTGVYDEIDTLNGVCRYEHSSCASNVYCCPSYTIDYSNCDDAATKCQNKGGTLSGYTCTVSNSVAASEDACPEDEDLHCTVQEETTVTCDDMVFDLSDCDTPLIVCADIAHDYGGTSSISGYTCTISDMPIDGIALCANKKITIEEEFIETSCPSEDEEEEDDDDDDGEIVLPTKTCTVTYNNCSNSEKETFCNTLSGSTFNSLTGVCNYSAGILETCKSKTCTTSQSNKDCTVTYSKCDTTTKENMCNNLNGTLSNDVCTYQIDDSNNTTECNSTYVCRSDEVDSNPNTGSLLLYVVYLVGTLSLCYGVYSIYKFKKNK